MDMDAEGLKLLFITFLQDQDSYEDFAFELFRQKNISVRNYLRKFKTPKDCRRLVFSAFNWDDADRDTIGGNIWQILDAKWLKECGG